MLSGRSGDLVVPQVRADETIGVASVVRNDVNGVLFSGTSRSTPAQASSAMRPWKPLKTVPRSSSSPTARIWRLGRIPTVKLNHFVSSGPSSYGKATINVAKGVFRFTTGHSDKRAYEINTGVATIGVRGTIFEGEETPRRTKLHVVEGVVDVRTKNGRICELRAGQSALITELGCKPIFGFDPGFSTELTELQEFSQLQLGEQGDLCRGEPGYVFGARRGCRGCRGRRRDRGEHATIKSQ